MAITSMFSRRRRRSRARKEWICERRCQVSVSGVVYMYFRDCFALKPFRDYNLCSVCILPQPAFYSQSAVCILHTLCILPLVRSLQSAVRSLRFTLTAKKTHSYRNACIFSTEKENNEYFSFTVFWSFSLQVSFLSSFPGYDKLLHHKLLNNWAT